MLPIADVSERVIAEELKLFVSCGEPLQEQPAEQARAREAQADKLFHEILAIAADSSGDYITTADGKHVVDHEHIARARLRVDSRKWKASKLAPKKYGNRISHDVKEPGPNLHPAILITVDGQTRDPSAR